jgi:two-component system phosphate regulon sensor histidine kinase PhoR
MVSTESLIATEADSEVGGTRTRLLQNIRRNTVRLNKLVGDLLDISRIQTGTMKLSIEPTLLREAVRESIETVRPLAKAKNLTIKTQMPSRPVLIKADPSRLVQILINLLSNAVSFTPEGGTVKVTTTINDGTVDVQVTDTGIGMTQEQQRRIFERFYRGSAESLSPEWGWAYP